MRTFTFDLCPRGYFLILLLALVSACGGGGGSSSGGSPTTPSGTTSPPSANAGSLVTQNGCAATYTCPNRDVSGNENPSTPTFDTVTLMTGTSSSCRADIYRNSQSPELPVELTIRRPSADSYFWTGEGSDVGTSPPNGSASTAGPHRLNVTNFGGGNISSGQTITRTLTLSIRRSAGADRPVFAQCAVSVWGFVVPGR